MVCQAVTEGDLQEEVDVCRMIASFRYVRCNYNKHDSPEYFLYESICGPAILVHFQSFVFHNFLIQNMNNSFLLLPLTLAALANRTAEKTKPSALDLMLLFKESVRLRQASAKGKSLSLREVLFACVGEYNKTVGSHRVSWQQYMIVCSIQYNILYIY